MTQGLRFQLLLAVAWGTRSAAGATEWVLAVWTSGRPDRSVISVRVIR